MRHVGDRTQGPNDCAFVVEIGHRIDLDPKTTAVFAHRFHLLAIDQPFAPLLVTLLQIRPLLGWQNQFVGRTADHLLRVIPRQFAGELAQSTTSSKSVINNPSFRHSTAMRKRPSLSRGSRSATLRSASANSNLANRALSSDSSQQSSYLLLSLSSNHHLDKPNSLYKQIARTCIKVDHRTTPFNRLAVRRRPRNPRSRLSTPARRAVPLSRSPMSLQ